MEVQTRSEKNGIDFHKSIRAALDAADKDKTIWKISFSVGKERVRLVRCKYKRLEVEEWVLEMLDKISDDVVAQQEWLRTKGTQVKKPA